MTLAKEIPYTYMKSSGQQRPNPHDKKYSHIPYLDI